MYSFYMTLYGPEYGASCGSQILSVRSHMCVTVKTFLVVCNCPSERRVIYLLHLLGDFFASSLFFVLF